MAFIQNQDFYTVHVNCRTNNSISRRNTRLIVFIVKGPLFYDTRSIGHNCFCNVSSTTNVGPSCRRWCLDYRNSSDKPKDYSSNTTSRTSIKRTRVYRSIEFMTEWGREEEEGQAFKKSSGHKEESAYDPPHCAHSDARGPPKSHH